jgi:hypothetical protein
MPHHHAAFWQLSFWQPYIILQAIAAIFVIASVTMKGMVRLRVASMVSNVFDLLAATLSLSPVSILKYGIVLPVNSIRLREMLRLVRRTEFAASGAAPTMEWLKPFMHRRPAKAGEMIFKKGDAADRMFLVATGKFELIESGIEFANGGMVGELGLLSPDNHRTQSLRCVHSGDLYEISYDHVRELYFQNPEFGFYFLQLTSKRLFENIARLERELEQRPPLKEAATA